MITIEKQWLENMGIMIGAHIVSIGGVMDEPAYLDWANPSFDKINDNFPGVNAESAEKMKAAIAMAKADVYVCINPKSNIAFRT